MVYDKSLFVFRRDLRLDDNTALIAALKKSKEVYPCFIFDPRQVKSNPYRSDNAVQFMVESLKELDESLKKKGASLHLFYGRHEDVIKNLSPRFDAVFTNRDYTPYSISRDKAIEKSVKIDFNQFADCLLNEPEAVSKDDGDPYTVFTPFMRKAKKNKVREPVRNKHKNYGAKKLPDEVGSAIYSKVLSKENKDIFRRGGRAEAVSILKRISDFKNYSDVRDFPAIEGTTGLSAHNKFGTISIREVYWSIHEKLGFQHILLNELYWRDFFHHVAFHYPYVFGKPFREKYEKLKWDNDAKKFKAWCEGRTGFPIVDAGMRELNTVGFMHNRVRMIVASFLTKDLHIDWRKGEKYFAQRLVDYDPSVNNGNWQWSASTGCDAQPYFRIFNPWSQQKRYDAKCRYIKKWIPELESLSADEIHNLEKESPDGLKYPSPMVDHGKESKEALRRYKSVS